MIVRFLIAHLFHAAGVDYPDLQEDIRSAVAHVVEAAVADVTATLEARIAKLEAQAAGGAS